jgi:ATP-dependent Lhr-like helicase
MAEMLKAKNIKGSRPGQGALDTMNAWFVGRGWQPFKYQQSCWRQYLSGKSGLVHASTGTGKTYSIWPGPLIEFMSAAEQAGENLELRGKRMEAPLTVLWITPLRALATDIAASLLAPVEELGLPFSVETRTSDTSSSRKAKQKEKLPSCLVTTPESVSILLSYPQSDRFKTLKLVVVDEWHELLGSKRGVQVELALARLRKLAPHLRVWGLSATLGNLETALATLVGAGGVLVQGECEKQVLAQTVLPESIDQLPWTGHTGFPMVEEVIDIVDQGRTSIVFTNTRSQTEQWYQRIIEARDDYCGQAALHHGSLDSDVRRFVEQALKEERLKCVISTSSLDLGVDFSPVDKVIQVGSPKGVARAMQRAGRSGHSPEQMSKIFLVPCHALEVVEMAAARLAMADRKIEKRFGLNKPIDVLCQHVTTVALGSGFKSQELFEEVRTTNAFKNLREEDWQWVLNFVGTGGAALNGYPEFHRIKEEDGVFEISDKSLALKHRLSIGTIVSDQAMDVCYINGGRIGQVEESFISRLKKGDCFLFAGRYLDLVEVRGMKALVRRSASRSGIVPRWMGGRLPLSTELSWQVRKLISDASYGAFDEEEMQFVRPLLDLQARRSCLPEQGQILVERFKSRDGHHLFVYSFEGRMVNEGLANLTAFRLSRLAPATFSIAVNDWGFEILSPQPISFGSDSIETFFKGYNYENLAEEITQCLNSTEMARRQFREIARVAGLIFQGYPGASKTIKQVQISSSLLYDVFVDFDPGNLLVRQAHDEVMEKHLEISRMIETLQRLSASEIVVVDPVKASPFCMPLMVDRLRGKLSSEKLAQRVLRMHMDLAGDMRR